MCYASIEFVGFAGLVGSFKPQKSLFLLRKSGQ
jgi:hypothetical protein